MPEMDGIEATRRLKAIRPSLGIVALTGLDEQRAVRDMLVAGASGYVLKDADGDEIVHAIRKAAEGGAVLSEAVTPSVIDELTEALERERRRARQLEVAQDALLERAARRQQLIGRVGHELRTPVTVILGLAQSLRRAPLAPEEMAEALETLETRAQGLARLVTRFEAALEAGLTEWADVTALAHEIAADRRARSSSRLRTPRDGHPEPHRGARGSSTSWSRTRSPSRPPGEAVDDPCRRDIRRTPRSASSTAGRASTPSAAARIFEPLEQAEDLYTRTHQGAGLGLSLARLSARAMDGDVDPRRDAGHRRRRSCGSSRVGTGPAFG